MSNASWRCDICGMINTGERCCGCGEPADEAEVLRSQLATKERELLDWENREASVCPEDVGFEEYIKVLQSRERQSQAALAAKERELKETRTELAAYELLEQEEEDAAGQIERELAAGRVAQTALEEAIKLLKRVDPIHEYGCIALNTLGCNCIRNDIAQFLSTPPAQAGAKKAQPSDDDRIYPCDACGRLRSKNEGGTVFTVCDECWDKNNPPGVASLPAREEDKP